MNKLGNQSIPCIPCTISAFLLLRAKVCLVFCVRCNDKFLCLQLCVG